MQASVVPRFALEVNMKKLLLATLSIGLITCTNAWAQSRVQLASAPESKGARAVPAKSVTVSGRVSNDGRHFLLEPDNEVEVSNATVFKGREGNLVTVKGYFDSTRNQIQIVSVNRVQPEVR
jgi:hypothetical protein